jgi:hypothetical protein
MYSNTHSQHLIEIINLMCNQNNINEQLQHEISKLSQILIKQNYFQYQDILYIQEESLSIGTPNLSVFF